MRIPEANDPNKNPVLYHYCSTSAFIGIVQSRSLWLSDINTMNDFAEMHWAYDRFIEAANLEWGNLSKEVVEKIDVIVSDSQRRVLPFICSFSADGDVLSQWRAYADDGCGVAIGFDAKKIESLAIRSCQIEYSRQKQVQHFQSFLRAAYKVYLDLAESEKEDFLFHVGANMGVDFCCFKIPAFAEEKEVRIIRALNVNPVGSDFQIQDPGGNGEDEHSRQKLPLKFRSRLGGIVCYIELPLVGLGNDFIKEVIIGPKNPTNGPEISTLLLSNGMERAKLKKSAASYR